MNEVRFSWDHGKNRSNQRKHGVSFEEVKSVFYDENAREFFDSEHSDEEDRFILLGISTSLRVLIVCYCQRRGRLIRIISARKADSAEESEYWENVK